MLRLTLNHFKLGTFARSALSLMSGAALAQLVTLASLPVLSRLYDPGQFGILALYLALTGFGSLLATARYEMAIILPADERNAFSLAQLSLLISLAMGTFSLVLVLLVHGISSQMSSQPYDLYWLYMVPLSITIAGYFQTFTYLLTRNRHFKIVAASRLIQAIAIAITSIAFTGILEQGLIYGTVLGQLISLLFITAMSLHRWRNELSVINTKRIFLNAYRYRDFPKVNSLHVSVDILQTSGIPLVISTFFGQTMLGFYSFTIRVMRAPLGLIGSALSQVFYQHASAKHNRGEPLRPLLAKILLYLAAMSGLVLLQGLFAPPLFAFIFGEEWYPAGEYAQLLLPWIILSFIFSPVSQLPIILNHQRRMLFNAIIGNMVILFSVLFGAWSGSIKDGFILLSVLITIYFIYLGQWFWHIAGEEEATGASKG